MLAQWSTFLLGGPPSFNLGDRNISDISESTPIWFFFFWLLFLRQGLTGYSRLVPNAHQSSCLSLPNVRIRGVHHCAQLTHANVEGGIVLDLSDHELWTLSRAVLLGSMLCEFLWSTTLLFTEKIKDVQSSQSCKVKPLLDVQAVSGSVSEEGCSF